MNASKILKRLIQLTSNVTNAFTTALYTADHLNQTLHLKEHHTLSLNFDEKTQIPFGKGLIGNVAVEKKVAHSDHLYGDVPRLPIYKKKENLKCILIVPVVFDDLEGVLVLDSKESHSFSAKTQKIVAGFAEQMAWHLHLASLLENGREDSSFPYHEMIQFNRSLSEPLDRPIIIKRLLRFTPAIIKCDAVAVILFDSSRQVGNVAGHHGWDQELADLRVIPGKGIAGSTAKNRIPLITKIVDRPRAGIFSEKEKSSPFQSVLSVPIVQNDDLMGVVICASRQLEGFHQADLNKMVMTCGYAAQALLYADKKRQWNEDQNHDPVTGIPSYRFLLDRRESIEKDVLSRNNPVFFLTVHLKGLPRIYEKHGVIPGDRLVNQIVSLLFKTAPNPKDIFRYSDTTFLIILREAKKDEIQQLEMKLNRIFKKNAFQLEGEPVEVNVDLGLANYPKDGHDVYKIIGASLARASHLKAVQSA